MMDGTHPLGKNTRIAFPPVDFAVMNQLFDRFEEMVSSLTWEDLQKLKMDSIQFCDELLAGTNNVVLSIAAASQASSDTLGTVRHSHFIRPASALSLCNNA